MICPVPKKSPLPITPPRLNIIKWRNCIERWNWDSLFAVVFWEFILPSPKVLTLRSSTEGTGSYPRTQDLVFDEQTRFEASPTISTCFSKAFVVQTSALRFSSGVVSPARWSTHLRVLVVDTAILGPNEGKCKSLDQKTRRKFSKPQYIDMNVLFLGVLSICCVSKNPQ